MYIYIKRIIDLFISIIGIIVISPILLILAIIIKLESPGPVFFKQRRVGIKKVPFYIYKFRTMRIDTPANTPTWMLSNPDIYITKVGRVIRKCSLDELPQLFNIIKGDMSLIGPRPVVEAESQLVAEREKVGAYNVLPGLTGWAQINGRDEVGTYEKACLDGEYVKKQNLIYDIKIFVGTIAYVLKMDGVVEGVMSTVDTIESERIN